MFDGAQLGKRAALAALLATAMMFGALFPPFVSSHCIFCPDPAYLGFRTDSLIQGLDGWVALAVVIAMGAMATAHLMGIRPRATSVGSLSLALTCLAFAIVESVDASGRVLRSDAALRPVGPHGQTLLPDVTQPTAFDVGFYLFVLGATVAVIAAAVIVLATWRGRPTTRILTATGTATAGPS
jgi:hypothetical protein